MINAKPSFADRPNRHALGAIVALIASMLLLDSLICVTFVPPARADSEASSEAGSESGFIGGRRRRGYYRRMMRQQMQQQNKAQNRLQAGHEQQVQQNQRAQDMHRRSLNGANTTRNYNFGGRRHRPNQSQNPSQNQTARSTSSAGQPAAQQASATP